MERLVTADWWLLKWERSTGALQHEHQSSPQEFVLLELILKFNFKKIDKKNFNKKKNYKKIRKKNYTKI